MTLRFLLNLLYQLFYYLLYLVLIALLCITPSDAIRQAWKNHQKYNIAVIGGCYFLTACIALVIFSFRISTNRSVLKAIPKTWIPIEKGEVDKKVRAMIVASLNRSASIAWDSHPRVNTGPATIVSESDAKDAVARAPGQEESKRKGRTLSRKTQTEGNEQTIMIPSHDAAWGEITHNGWASPASPDLPNLQYIMVIMELPHLIEAKAVSLAPPDPDSKSDPPIPNIEFVELLQRPASMGLRDYLGHLVAIGTLSSTDLVAKFIAAYEHARFSTSTLSEHEFRELMKQFAEILRSMTMTTRTTEESDTDDDGSSSLTPESRRSSSNASSKSRSSSRRSVGTIRTAYSRRPGTDRTLQSGFITAPASPSMNRRTSRSKGVANFAPLQRPYYESSSSSSSLRSTSERSVVKLSRSNEDALPYTLTVPRYAR
ncbi:sucrase ferredoxin domain-containing protein [Phlyctema vagabunda]|uniref:Defect at low temperature protein 1 n=1 Tax=Phlyctema vagabunda TaxID=108571 RepID=A0ABR4PTL9_9HELO